ncbi:hypothetical protein BV20DRAFT_88178 [Pilatotrama ljubarskyi]|nr:hypothetical protein BV20DRAFT_88178 [Pilatotrama ljubarskyi]
MGPPVPAWASARVMLHFVIPRVPRTLSSSVLVHGAYCISVLSPLRWSTHSRYFLVGESTRTAPSTNSKSPTLGAHGRICTGRCSRRGFFARRQPTITAASVSNLAIRSGSGSSDARSSSACLADFSAARNPSVKRGVQLSWR